MVLKEKAQTLHDVGAETRNGDPNIEAPQETEFIDEWSALLVLAMLQYS